VTLKGKITDALKTVKPCVACGSNDIKAYDDSSDECFIIRCRKCGLTHIGAFGESTFESWNAAKSVNDLDVLIPPKGERHGQDGGFG
jgi:hypothetical protein